MSEESMDAEENRDMRWRVRCTGDEGSKFPGETNGVAEKVE